MGNGKSWGSMLALVLLLGAGAARADDEPYHARVGSDGVQRVQLLAGSYFFRPAHVIVKAGVPVELTVQMEQGVIPHSFVLEAPQAGLALRTELAVQPKVLRFVPAMAGRYLFYCAHKLLFFASHRQRGMEGVFEVVD